MQGTSYDYYEQVQQKRKELLMRKCQEFNNPGNRTTKMNQMIVEPKSMTMYCYLFKGKEHF